MKIAELRKLLENTNEDLLKKTIVEVYKLVPSAKKSDADNIIADVLNGNTTKKVKKDNGTSFAELSDEINTFLENVYEQNYFVPNRAVPKKDRPKWRFLVKRYVKELDKITLDNEHYDEACNLLVKLYAMMCHACNYYLFATRDPFQSVGIEQFAFYSLVVNKVLSKSYCENNITTLLILAATSGLSMNSLSSDQESYLISSLDKSDYLYMAVKIAKEKIVELKEKLKALPQYSNNRYFIENDINNYCDFILMAEIKLQEYDDAIAYYFNNSEDFDKEVTLYKALDIVDWFAEDDKLWLEYYNYGLKKKIKPRDQLKDEYKQKAKNKK